MIIPEPDIIIYFYHSVATMQQQNPAFLNKKKYVV